MSEVQILCPLCHYPYFYNTSSEHYECIQCRHAIAQRPYIELLRKLQNIARNPDNLNR